ncbi:gamma-glutamylcyclotransferase family protein [Dietzia aurantiaca]|uniref:Putative gamma-glutamylcyclotransferase n=1 Tax=Dietzia aurantiaca TaxID=983873 RepID=A0ABV9PML1_9ACTN
MIATAGLQQEETPMPEHLFVYGILAPGRPNAHVLAEVPGTWRPATISGSLYERGWGASHGFPGIVLGSGGEVAGFVFSSDDLVEQWTLLDELEGDEYSRVTVEARLDEGGAVAAQVYALRD